MAIHIITIGNIQIQHFLSYRLALNEKRENKIRLALNEERKKTREKANRSWTFSTTLTWVVPRFRLGQHVEV